MQKRYQDEMDQIHAPEELIQRTRHLVQDELQKESDTAQNDLLQAKGKVIHFPYKQLTAAACAAVIILAGGVGYYQVNNQIHIDTAAMSGSTQLDSELALGQIGATSEDSSDSDITDGFELKASKGKNGITAMLYDTVESSKIRGHKVYLSYDKSSKTYYAAYKKDQFYYLATGTKLNEKEFLKELRKALK